MSEGGKSEHRRPDEGTAVFFVTHPPSWSSLSANCEPRSSPFLASFPPTTKRFGVGRSLTLVPRHPMPVVDPWPSSHEQLLVIRGIAAGRCSAVDSKLVELMQPHFDAYGRAERPLRQGKHAVGLARRRGGRGRSAAVLGCSFDFGHACGCPVLSSLLLC
jgi:hypothetical protein